MNKKIDGKIAVFICGPVRYVTLVNERLETVLKDYDYDCFFHLWKADLGNKVRQGGESDYKELFDHPRAKVVIMQSPYSEDDFKDRIGTKTNSSSTINVTMGMFFSVNVLCHYLKQLPDFDQYKYILRLRTDLAILNDDFASLLSFEPNTLTIPDKSHISKRWITDQICFGPVESFFRLWSFQDMNEIYTAYEKGVRNPEQTLSCRFEQYAKDIKLNRSFVRFRDYHIVHFPPREPLRDWTPKCVEDALNSSSIEDFFLHSDRYLDKAQIKAFITQRCLRWKQEDKAYLDELFKLDSVSKIADVLFGHGNFPRKHYVYRCEKAIALLRPEVLREIQVLAEQVQPSNPRYCFAKKVLHNIEKHRECQTIFKEGINELGRGNISSALSCFDKALTVFPVLPEINFARAVTLAQLKKLLMAIEACKAELELNPNHYGAKKLLTKLEKRLSKFMQTDETQLDIAKV